MPKVAPDGSLRVATTQSFTDRTDVPLAGSSRGELQRLDDTSVGRPGRVEAAVRVHRERDFVAVAAAHAEHGPEQPFGVDARVDDAELLAVLADLGVEGIAAQHGHRAGALGRDPARLRRRTGRAVRPPGCGREYGDSPWRICSWSCCVHAARSAWPSADCPDWYFFTTASIARDNSAAAAGRDDRRNE